ncbi:helix-turn-helix transcriptional regulator [Nocardia aurea]|uniref:helix-turn-helix transcriptional regulator n=1 Tax=Nocardia aurea TaxID=2144174 RepID=UPI0033AFB12F
MSAVEKWSQSAEVSEYLRDVDWVSADDISSKTISNGRFSSNGNNSQSSVWTVRSALAYLSHDGADRLRVAQLLAVVDQPTASRIHAEVLDADPVWVRAVIRELTEAGLVAYSRFRRRDIRDAVVRETPLMVRTSMHHRVAGVLHAGGAPAMRVADHLVSAGTARFPWSVSLLRAAAGDAIADDQITRAVDYLELASRLADDDERAIILTTLAVVRWRLSPSTSGRSFGRLIGALRGGLIPPQCVPMVARYLLWHGRAEEAAAALDQLDAAADGGDATGPARLAAMNEWLACNYPGVLEGRAAAPEPDRTTVRSGSASAVRTEPDVEAARLLIDVLTNGASAGAVAAAQRMLRGHRLDDETFGALLIALDCLTYSDQLDVATSWCEALVLEAAARRAPTWQSIFAIWRSAMSVREGNLHAAIDRASGAVGRINSENLGTYTGLAVASLVAATTAAGRYREAAAYLDHALPDSVLESRIGLQFLHARGHYHMAVGAYDQALEDFSGCGERMRRWNMDIPGLVAWRNDLAELYLRLGEPRNARRWASAHLDRIGGVDRHRTAGVSVRLIAASSPVLDQVALLRQSVSIANSGGNQLELATALAALSDAYHAIGERDRARAANRRATRLAEQCGAEPLRIRLAGPRGESAPMLVSLDQPPRALDTLSPAELKVAELAAAGRRNRDIAKELHITTSTVEQHLTRVYRKLRVARRSDLVAVLAATDFAPVREVR